MTSIAYENGDISLEEIKKAAQRIQSEVNLTPVIQSSELNEKANLQLFFKCEVFQKTGSFKFRGAFNAISRLVASTNTPGRSPLSVVTHSSGNHAAAIALAAKLHNIPAHIVVPRNTPKIKQDAVKSYGGNLILCEPTIDAREAACADVQAENPGAVFIPPYNHPWVICGQGTIGLEFMQQTAGLDAIVVPVSGGGMISGIAVAAKSLNPSIKIIAAEPSGRNLIADVAACKLAHELIQFEKTETICDGLQARLGSITWPIVRDLVDEVVIISEQDVVEAMQLCYERLKVVVEPSGAAGVAAVLKLRQQNPECAANLQKVGVILCGGNVDFEGKFPGFWNNWL